MNVDFSIIPSYRCNLKCWFCMYDASPENTSTLDYSLAKKFIETIDWEIINSVGFYGGEISIDMPLYQSFLDLIPKDKPRFAITNGSWTRNLDICLKFLDFITENRIRTKVSCTPEHIKFQNVDLLKKFQEASNGNIFIKENDDTKGRLLSMGRLSARPFECTQKCRNMSRPVVDGELPAYRMALEPSGEIILQSCDGRYPVIGSYNDTFDDVLKNLSNFSPERCIERYLSH